LSSGAPKASERSSEGSSRDADLVAEAVDLYRQVHQGLRALIIPSWLHLNLTMAQLKGLFVLIHGPATIGQLATSLGITQSTASILVERLVRLGLVVRDEDPGDRRRVVVRLSPEGERIVTELGDAKREHLHSTLASISEDDLAALVQGLRALLSAVAATQPPSREAPEDDGPLRRNQHAG
jgi:DNA-binding MarR family transcriptional regulator